MRFASPCLDSVGMSSCCWAFVRHKSTHRQKGGERESQRIDTREREREKPVGSLNSLDVIHLMRSRKRQNCGTSTLLFIDESVAVQSTDLFPSARVRGRLLRIHGTRRHRTEKTCKRNRSQCNIYSLSTNRFFFFFFFLCVCVFPLLFVEKKNATG